MQQVSLLEGRNAYKNSAPSYFSWFACLQFSIYYLKVSFLDFLANSCKCPECGISLPSNRISFMKHLGVVHERVLQYVGQEEKARGPQGGHSQGLVDASAKERMEAEKRVAAKMAIRAVLDSDSD